MRDTVMCDTVWTTRRTACCPLKTDDPFLWSPCDHDYIYCKKARQVSNGQLVENLFADRYAIWAVLCQQMELVKQYVALPMPTDVDLIKNVDLLGRESIPYGLLRAALHTGTMLPLAIENFVAHWGDEVDFDDSHMVDLQIECLEQLIYEMVMDEDYTALYRLLDIKWPRHEELFKSVIDSAFAQLMSKHSSQLAINQPVIQSSL